MPIKIKKYIAFFLLFFIIGSFALIGVPESGKAQVITVDTPSIFSSIWDKLVRVWDKINGQMLATAFKKSLGTFLNKLAYDSAVYVAAGGTGQKGLVNPFSKKALSNLADSVAGEFIDELAQKSGLVGDPEKLAECIKTCPKDASGKTDATCSKGCEQSTGGAFGTYSLCEPVDLTAKANLLMSFKKPKEPPTPKCSLTKMKQAAQESAKDNLLEFNAGFEESEGGLNIILSGVSAEQNFAGTKAQLELSRISDDLATLLPDLQNIMKTIQNALQVDRNNTTVDDVRSLHTDTSAQAVADGQLDMLHSIEGKLGEYDGTLFTLQENAGKCLSEYSQHGSVCGNGIANTGEDCDIKNKFCSSFCKINGGATNDCGTSDEQCPVPNSAPSSNGMTCLGLGFAPGSGGTVDCDNNCHYKPNCFPTATAECDNAEFMPSCADFYTNASLTMCNKNASFAMQYVGTILGTVSSYLTQTQDWNKKIENKELKTVQANDPADIAKAFNPEANEMGQFGKIQGTLSQKTQDQLEHEKLKTLAEGPCKGVTKPITGEVVTPSAATCAAINEALAKSTKGQETFTGTFADAFGIFVNTLTSKLMERYFKKGLSLVFDKDGLQDESGKSKCTSWEDTKDEDKAKKSLLDFVKKRKCADKTEDILRSGASLGGKAAAEKALGDLLNTSTETGGQQDILSILAACPPEQPALNNCIIDEPLRRAIEKQFTVKEAMEAYKKSGGSEGLDPKKPFGYILVGTAMDEPDFKNGYPYRSMLYLRKYRIIPVGWELAAQYIKDIEAVKQVHTLDSIVEGFDNPASPFFGLADPAWVLKAPAVFCARQGPGPEIISTEMQCEKISTGAGGGQCVSDDYQARKVSRKTWCADEQTCLEEGESGDCKRYGYCTLEKPSWKLGGTQCDKPFASCEGYTNSITKANYTVLENTLNKTDCNQSNVGCQWYCQDAPKMCKGGTRGGQPCDINNDCASIYCSVGTCVNSGFACSYDNDCGSGAIGFCSNNNVTSCTTATVGTDCGAGNQCILCNTGARACVNGDTPGDVCTTNASCGRGVVDGVCEEGGGVWSCKESSNSGLIGEWMMNDVSGGSIKDTSKSGKNGTLVNGPSLVNDGCVSGSCLQFDGANDYVDIGDFTGKYTNKVTVTAWIKSMSAAPWNDIISGSCGDMVLTLNGGKLTLVDQCGNGIGGPDAQVNGSTSINDDKWHYVAGVYDGSSLKVYVDGVLDGEQTQRYPAVGGGPINGTPFNAGILRIGSYNGASEFFQGQIDDVRIYNGLIMDRINLDRDVKKCEAKDAGCNQFIKVAPGANLIGNSGFEDDADASATITTAMGTGYINRWYLKNSSTNSTDLKAEINQTTVHSGKNSLYIEMDSDPADFTQGLWLGDNSTSYSVVPAGFAFNPEKSYTVSAWVYIDDAATGKISIFAGLPFFSSASAVTTQTSSQWERISLTIPAGTSINEIRIFPSAGTLLTRFYIDDLQLEEGDTANNYVQYGSSNQAYLNGRRLQCEKQEVGCNLYTPSEGGDPIPAVIKTKDQCPAECAGYAPFYQMPSFFEPTDDPSDLPNIIPASGVSCSASSMGCEEFTNLDTVASGGEAKEYYTKLRQCAKPGTTTEATFYTWEGSEEAGFQLRAWRFKSVDHDSNAATPMRPYVTDNDYDCADITNPDCRTFYDQNGATFPEELSSTVFISADCHPLRKTIQGTRKDCRNSGGRTETPVVSGDPDIVICLYDAIPSQGLKCAAKEAGCREYRGSAGNNLRVLLNDDFEDLTSQDWTPSSLSSESLTIGGRSYILKNYPVGSPPKQSVIAVKNVADLVAQGKTYMLEFWAKPKFVPSGITTTINANFFGTAGTIPPFETSGIAISGDWNKYALGPLTFPRAPTADESLRFYTHEAGAVDTPGDNDCDGGIFNADCTAEFYLDNIVLREITDNPFLIKDSWKTPVSCMIEPEITKTIPTLPTSLSVDIMAAQVGNLTVDNSNGFDSPSGALVIDGEVIEYDGLVGNVFNISARGAKKTSSAAHTANALVWPIDEGAQLGCKEYTDRFNQKTYLRSFDKLCGEDKVGCTEMINSYNSRSMYEQTIKGEYIPRDAVEYIVDNPKIYCNASSKGCEKMGQPALGQSGEVSSWGETYLINDPDQYAQIACESNENMCSEFTTRTGGTTYFKDPKDALCEYHPSINIEGVITKGWFKKGVIPAALGGLIFYDSDGVNGPDTYAHLECADTSGVWDETKWTYSCPNDQVGCTEFQTPQISTLQTGSQYISAVGLTGFTPTINGATTVNPGNAIWQYRFDILESGNYNLALSTQNYSSANDPFTAAAIRHNLTISIDGVNKVNLDSASSPRAPQASPSAQSTMVNLGAIERGMRIISIRWTNDLCSPADCSGWNSNLQINSLILSKSAGSNYYNLEQGVDTSSCTGVVDPEKGCVAFYDAANPILNIKSSAISGNAFAPAACQKCSLDAASCSTLTACDPASENCCCTNNSAVTNPCDSNTILKVRADRQCAEWLACTESEKTTDSKGNIIEMCKKREACYKTGDGVECASDGLVSETKQNQTFDNPAAVDVPPHAGVVADVNLRSGYFKAGAHWSRVCQGNMSLSCQVDSDCGTDGPCIDQPIKFCSLDTSSSCSTNNDCQPAKGVCVMAIEGYYPYAKMEKVGLLGVDPIIFEDDFETYQAGVVLPQCSADATQTNLCGGAVAPLGACETNNKGICLDYWPTGSANATNKEFKFGGQSLLVLDSNTDLAKISSKNISVNNGSQYVFTAWLNTKELQGTGVGALNVLVAQVDSAGVALASAVQEESKDWMKYVIPFTATSGTLNIRIYMQNMAGANPIKAGSKAYVDMISLAPVLEIQNPADLKSLPENYAANAAAYADRSCRIFAKPDALSCKYRERNTGRGIQGWRGFCAEADPKNPDYCLQWWPIDLIEGEDISKF